VFEFYSPARINDNPVWTDVTDVTENGVGGMIDELYSRFSEPEQIRRYLGRLNRLDNVKDRDLYSEDRSTDDMTLDVVVVIFNKVNSGATHLSKGDLALAKICAQWPEARAEMNRRLNKWKEAGYMFKLDWLWHQQLIAGPRQELSISGAFGDRNNCPKLVPSSDLSLAQRGLLCNRKEAAGRQVGRMLAGWNNMEVTVCHVHEYNGWVLGRDRECLADALVRCSGCVPSHENISSE